MISVRDEAVESQKLNARTASERADDDGVRTVKRKGWNNDSDGEFWCGGWCTRCKLKKKTVNFSIESSISPTAPSNFVVDSKTLFFHTSLTVPYTNCYCQSLRVIVEESFLLSCDSAKDLFTVSLFCIIIFLLRRGDLV